MVAPGLRDTVVAVSEGGFWCFLFPAKTRSALSSPRRTNLADERPPAAAGDRPPNSFIEAQSRGRIDLVLIAILSRGHVLIEDVPGVGKTTLARAVGKALISSSRASSSPATRCRPTCSAISIYQRRRESFRVPSRPDLRQRRSGRRDQPRHAEDPIGPPRGDERGARARPTSGTLELSQPFMVIATQNPVEYLGTYPLPESQTRPFLPAALAGVSRRRARRRSCSSGAAPNERSRGSVPCSPRPICSRSRRRSRTSGSRQAPRLLVRPDRRHPAAIRPSASGLDARRAGVLTERLQARAPHGGPLLRPSGGRPSGRRAQCSPTGSSRCPSDGFGTGPTRAPKSSARILRGSARCRSEALDASPVPVAASEAPTRLSGR